MDHKFTLTERHEFVALAVKTGKSNRAIAKELGVDEGTVRRDRKFLATPENERPVKVPRPKSRRSNGGPVSLAPTNASAGDYNTFLQ